MNGLLTVVVENPVVEEVLTRIGFGDRITGSTDQSKERREQE